jgi:cell division protein ZapA
MALVTVKIAGQAHTLGCADGQEQHLQSMAAEVERRVVQVRPVAGQGAEARLLVLAALMMADELHDLRAAMAREPGPPTEVVREVIKEVVREVPVVREVIREVTVEVPVEDSVFHAKLEALAARAEAIAAGLQHA